MRMTASLTRSLVARETGAVCRLSSVEAIAANSLYNMVNRRSRASLSPSRQRRMISDGISVTVIFRRGQGERHVPGVYSKGLWISNDKRPDGLPVSRSFAPFQLASIRCSYLVTNFRIKICILEKNSRTRTMMAASRMRKPACMWWKSREPASCSRIKMFPFHAGPNDLYR